MHWHVPAVQNCFWRNNTMTISLVPTRLPGVACALVMAFATILNAADASGDTGVARRRR